MCERALHGPSAPGVDYFGKKLTGASVGGALVTVCGSAWWCDDMGVKIHNGIEKRDVSELKNAI